MPSRLVTSGNQDSTVANQPDVHAMNNWFIPSTDESYTIVTHNGVTAGAMCPGFAEPEYWSDPGSPKYQNPDHFIARNGSDGLGTNGDTLLEGLDAMMSNGAELVCIEGWTDDVEYAGLYRSLDAEWTNPNQYINLMRRFNDLRTETLRLEFEGADAYYDTTSGNAGGEFRRSGDLDIQKLPGDDGGWNVGWVAEGEWMEFRDVYLAPGTYTFSVRYAANGTKNASLSVNGTSLGNVTLPSTGGTTNYETFSLGTTSVLEGWHTLRFTSGSTGGFNLDWVFVKRETMSVSLNSSLNNQYVTAVNGGAELVQADSAIVGNHQEFIICDRNGGTLEAGDLVNIQTRNGLYLAARAGGNNDLEADRMDPGGWERFTILKANGGGGTITSGTEIALESIDGYYVRTTSSGLLDVRGTTIEDATTFTMTTFDPLPSVSINFQPELAGVPSGYLADTSEVFGDRGNGFSYGWTTAFDRTRERNTDPDQRLDTLNHTQWNNDNYVWEIELPNGNYDVSITGGDPDWDNSFIEFVAEEGTANEVILASGDPSGVNFISGSATVTVSDGRLTISNGPNAVNNKINYVDITPSPQPSVSINFQPASAAVPSGYLADTSEVFGDRGNGYSYGWTTSFDATRERNSDPDQRLDTLNHTQAQGTDRVWEIELPNGDYNVSITGGDPDFDNSFIEFLAQEGTADEVTLVSGDPSGVNFVSGSATVTVSNGLLTIGNGANAVNNKINFVDINPL